MYGSGGVVVRDAGFRIRMSAAWERPSWRRVRCVQAHADGLLINRPHLFYDNECIMSTAPRLIDCVTFSYLDVLEFQW